MAAVDPSVAPRVELILQQIDSLPTLSPIVVRLVQLVGDPSVELRRLAQTVETDPSMTARVLAWCRRADLGVRGEITTVHRALTMMGLETARTVLLSAEVFEMFAPEPAREIDRAYGSSVSPGPVVDLAGLWRHSIATACAAEMLAEGLRERTGIAPSQAYVCGLLHDLGKLALTALLPRAYARIAALADDRQADIADMERRVLGLDHHSAGKRLAEHWGLPHAMQDVIWLHNQPAASLPDLPHRALVTMVGAADALARRLHIGWSGNYAATPDAETLSQLANVAPQVIERIERELHHKVAERGAKLGLDDTAGEELVVHAMAEANRQLGRLARLLDGRRRAGAMLSHAIETISNFHARAAETRSFGGTLAEVARSSAKALEANLIAILWQERPDAEWVLYRFGSDGQLLDTRPSPTPQGADNGLTLAQALPGPRYDIRQTPLLAWITEQLKALVDPSNLGLLPLTAGWGPSAVLIHDGKRGDDVLTPAGVAAVTAAWASTLAAAAKHDGARRLGERLADANRRLGEAQAAIVEAGSMERLRELAAGAAHEMNNPLTVISGNAQLLARRANTDADRQALRAIVSSSEKLTDLITSLHLFANPPKPVLKPTDLRSVVAMGVAQARSRMAAVDHGAAIAEHIEPTVIFDAPALAAVDSEQLSSVLCELVLNAMQSHPRTIIEVRAYVDDLDDRLMITVRDDGAGMNEHTLSHAFDPFFSDRPAGRRTGLGLARARRLVDLHGGELLLQSVSGGGTRATVLLPKWRTHDASPGVRKEAA